MDQAELRKTALQDVKQQAGARLGSYGGWMVAEDFGDEESEYQAILDSIGLIDLSSRGKIAVRGEDHVSFLHNMLTNDIKSLDTGNGCYAGVLDRKAHILADCYAFRFSDHILLETGSATTGKIIEHFQKYIIMEDVELKDVTDRFCWLSVEGPQAQNFLSRLTDCDVNSLKPYQHVSLAIREVPVELFRLSYTGQPGFSIFLPEAPGPALWTALLQAGQQMGLRPVGLRALNRLRIEAGIPWYGFDMDEANLWPETGLREAVSYNKGCYIGQEVMARLDAVARITKRLMGLHFKGELPERGTEIMQAGTLIGQVMSTCFVPREKRNRGMVYVKRDLAEAGTLVEINGMDAVLYELKQT